MLSLYKAMDVNEGIYYDNGTKVVVGMDLFEKFTSPEFGRKCMEMIRRLQSYKLNIKDQILLKAVCFLCPGTYICLVYSISLNYEYATHIQCIEYYRRTSFQ